MRDKEGEGKKIDDGQQDCHCHPGTLVPDVEKHLHPSSKGRSPLAHQLSFVRQLSLPPKCNPFLLPIYLPHSSPKPFPLRSYKFNTSYEILFRDARHTTIFEFAVQHLEAQHGTISSSSSSFFPSSSPSSTATVELRSQAASSMSMAEGL